jgi:hypothetical protein
MRRILSILMLLVLGLGPVVPAEALASGMASGWTGKVDEARLPACCRRGGKHHCEMGSSRPESASETIISAKDCCPFSPHSLTSIAPTASALASAPVSSIAYGTELRARCAHAAAATMSERRNWPKRGPPAAQIL